MVPTSLFIVYARRPQIQIELGKEPEGRDKA